MDFSTINISDLLGYGLWGYFVVFVLAVVESLPIIGFFVPGTTITSVFGLFASTYDILGYWELVVFSSVGAFFGDYISFILGKKGALLFSDTSKFFNTKYLEHGKIFFSKHGNKSIFLGRFIAPLRSVVPFVVGLAGVKDRYFIFWDIITVLLWSLSCVSVGYFFGNILVKAGIWSSDIGGFALFFVIIILLALFIIKKKRRVK